MITPIPAISALNPKTRKGGASPPSLLDPAMAKFQKTRNRRRRANFGCHAAATAKPYPIGISLAKRVQISINGYNWQIVDLNR